MANQAESLLSSLFKILFKGTRSFSEINELASLANKIDSRREASPRSMTYMMKNRGPRIKPRGTPQRIPQRAIYGRYCYKLRSLIKIGSRGLHVATSVVGK